MLETKHLTKIYRTKGGADVRALDDVSICFPETGMVFLLGKSGSGKSTLLNVCGGLDSPTSGVISVKGRSSKDFRQSDFDSYRNTFVGFIFQEYNILNEFTVEDNIALALELQGKPKDKKRIADILKQVDLEGYGKRKPNTLSGGQKQRIAIARALVKSPEIIMADEPTGALDSETGKQVFDTLKKLSKDKLVIVVSHDRDFAETYGDRIIELKDGKVISDVTKTVGESRDINENIRVVGDTLCVRRGKELTDGDFDRIREFLTNAESDIIIATGEQQVQEFKENNHIQEEGVEVFLNSEELPTEVKEYAPEDSRFIRSKLPAKHAFRIGISGLKTKRIRLVFTVLLCTLAFVFFGMLSTLTFYDSEATFKQSLKDSSYTMVQLGKEFRVKELWYYDGEQAGDYTYGQVTGYTKKEMENFVSQFGAEAFGASQYYYGIKVVDEISDYWEGRVAYVAYLDEENPLRQKITGKYPTEKNEICISSYTADVIYNCRMYDVNTGKLLELTGPKDVIGKELSWQGQNYKIVGILDSGTIPEKYDVLKNPENDNFTLLSGFSNELLDGLHLVAFFNDETYENLASNHYAGNVMMEFENQRVAIDLGTGMGSVYQYPEWGNAGYAGYQAYAEEGLLISFDGENKAPGRQEVYINVVLFAEILAELYNENPSVASEELMEAVYAFGRGGEDVWNEATESYEWVDHTEQRRLEIVQEIGDLLKAQNQTFTVGMRLYDTYESGFIGEVVECTVIGLWYDGWSYSGKVLMEDSLSQELWTLQRSSMTSYSEYYTNYKIPEDAIYETVFVPYDHSDAQTNSLWDIYSSSDYNSEDVRYTMTSQLVLSLQLVDTLVEELSKVFLYAGIVLAAFAALLLSNFIAVSISYKKREIGILRAVGARSVDVFKIFFSESFVITAICVIIAIGGTVAVCGAVNTILVDIVSASLFVFGPLSLLVLLTIAGITTVVATFLPVWNAAKKKPVESIRAL